MISINSHLPTEVEQQVIFAFTGVEKEVMMMSFV